MRDVEPADPLAQMCNADAGDIAGVPVDQVQALIQLNADQRAALDALSAASNKAAGDVRAACPSDMALTAPARLAVMEQRIDAMISAVQTLQIPLQKFYDSLNDEQRARFTALAEQQRQNSRRGRVSAPPSVVADCGITRPGVMDWPEAQIEQRLHPTDAQRAPLAALRDAAAKAEDMLKSCASNNATTLPARLAAISDRLNTMLDAVKTVHEALDKFYASLTDEQKAQFEAIGRERLG
jgi:gamma-glutamyl phosphate reductase